MAEMGSQSGALGFSDTISMAPKQQHVRYQERFAISKLDLLLITSARKDIFESINNTKSVWASSMDLFVANLPHVPPIAAFFLHK